MRTEIAPTFVVEILIAGDVSDARRVCRAECMEAGLCVTFDSTEFIYTAGLETGVIVCLTNYPRFPSGREELWQRAVKLAERLRLDLHQHSVMVRSPEDTLWISSRDGE